MHVSHLQEVNWFGVETQAECRELLYEMLPALLAPLFCSTFHVFPSDQLSYICMQNTNPESFTEVSRATPHLF